MRIFKVLALLAIGIIVSISSCKKEVYDTTPNTDLPSCDTLVFSKHIKPIFDTKCISCHQSGGTAPGDFTNPEVIKAQKDRIKFRAVVQGDMPPGAPLSELEKQRLGDWVDCGAKMDPINNLPHCDSILYSRDIKPLFDANCVSCHKANGTAPGDFTKLSVIQSQANRIKIRAVVQGDMPPSGPMSDADKALLGKWIDCGAKGDVADSIASYKNDISPIFLKYCTKCHKPGGNGPGDYTKYADIKNAVDNKNLEGRVFVIQDMPADTNKLTTTERVTLKEWLDAGAPNN